MSAATLPLPDLSVDTGQPPPGGPIKLGSDAHKTLFCRMLLDTFNPYKPAVIDWPKLDAGSARPARQPADLGHRGADRGQGQAACRDLWRDRSPIRCCARRSSSNGFEEGRHKDVLANLVEAYGIKLAPEPDYPRPRDPEWAFMVTGYSECIDSFFAFGLFEVARRSGFFPPELVDTFEPVMQEEGRHILFFVNWVAWHRRNMPLVAAALVRAEDRSAVWAFLIWERIGIARDVNGAAQDNNFTVTGAKESASISTSAS